MNHSQSNPASTFDVLFSFGFRPFFLGASVYAALAMALWLAWIGIHAANASLTWISIAVPPHVWHAHEMIYGFGLAAVAGFLLTAVPNWTGAGPVNGQPLVALFSVWVAGRLAMTVSAFMPPVIVALLDLAFVPMLGLHVLRQLMVKPQPRNMVFLALLSALFAGNVVYHLAVNDALALDMTLGLRAGLLTLVVLVVIIGGRIVPSFTHNHLMRISPKGPMPKRSDWLDRAAPISTVVFALLVITPAPDTVVAVAAFAAALTNAVRLWMWRGLATLDSPIVWVLHLGYAWIVLGLLLWALAAATAWISEVSALHALGSGGVATMILAVMSRASLGHTGRPLVAPKPVVIAYGLVSLAALLRTFGPALAPAYYNAVMLAAGLAWITAFVLFAYVYAPMLTQPRSTSRMSPA